MCLKTQENRLAYSPILIELIVLKIGLAMVFAPT